MLPAASSTTLLRVELVYIEKLNAEAGEAVVFDQVLAIVDGENSKFGTPAIEGAKVEAKVVQVTARARRSPSLKYRPKKDSKLPRRAIVSPTPQVQIEKISVVMTTIRFHRRQGRLLRIYLSRP